MRLFVVNLLVPINEDLSLDGDSDIVSNSAISDKAGVDPTRSRTVLDSGGTFCSRAYARMLDHSFRNV